MNSIISHAVVLPVDVQDREDDQVGEDEGDHAAEADAAVPQHGGERDVADGAHEGQHRDDRADERAPDRRDDRVVDEEEATPRSVIGTQAATAPAMSRPMTMSRRTAAHSITKTWDTEVNPAGERSLLQMLPVAVDAHVHGGVALHGPGEAALGLRARVSQQPLRAGTAGRATASRMIMMGPPTNSARVNCQPSSSAMMTPSSMTRLVEAISNAIAAVKLAPLRNSERASATAA